MQLVEKHYGFELKATREEAAKAASCLLRALDDGAYQEVFFVGELDRARGAGNISEFDMSSGGYVGGRDAYNAVHELANLFHIGIGSQEYTIIINGTQDAINRRKAAALRIMREEHLVPCIS